MALAELSALLLFLIVAILVASSTADVDREGRQRTLTKLTTVTVATTEVAFSRTPAICIKLINATRPCIGRRAVWNPQDGQGSAPVADIHPSTVIKTDKTAEPVLVHFDDVTQLDASLNTMLKDQQRAPQSNFFKNIANGFSSAFGLNVKERSIVTETKTMTKVYMETMGYNYFEIRDCIPPVLHFPVCRSTRLNSTDYYVY